MHRRRHPRGRADRARRRLLQDLQGGPPPRPRVLSGRGHEERRGVLLLAAAALLWSSGGLAIKSVHAAPLVVSFWRSLIAAATLFVLQRPPRPPRTARFAAAVACYAGCLTTFVVATKWTSAANAIFLQYSGIIWVMLLSPWLLKEPLRMVDVLAAAAAFAGMGLFFAGRLDPQGLDGCIVAVVSGMFFAGIFLTLRGARGRVPEAAVAWGNLAAAVLALPWVAHRLVVDLASALVLLFLGVVQIGLSYALFVRGLRRVNATEASLVSMLEPVFNPVWVFLVLREAPSAYAVAGGVIVLAAVAWRTLLQPGAPRPVAP